jgi:hypothetical protein
MARFNRETYCRIFDELLSEELYYSSSAASESNIAAAIKKVLGKSLKMNYISLYYDLFIDSELNVHFKIKDPDGEIVPIDLIYGE